SVPLNGGGLLNGNVNLLGSNGVANGNVKSNLLNGINGQLTVLSKKTLVQLCLNVGGGSGCGIGSRNTLLGLIDTRLGLLSTQSLASLCVSAGGSCGGGGSGA